MRHAKIRKFFLLIFVFIPARVFCDTLYGFSDTGILYEINKTTALCTPLRMPLPDGQYAGLLAVNDKFYTFDGTSGKFYRFGLASGDEIHLGTTSHGNLGGMGIRPTDGQSFIAVGNYIGKLDVNNGNIYSLVDVTGPQGQEGGRIIDITFEANGTNRIITWSGSPSSWTGISWGVDLITGVVPPNSSFFYGCCRRLHAIAVGQNAENIWLAGGSGIVGTQPPWTSNYVNLLKFINNNSIEYYPQFRDSSNALVPIAALAFNVELDTNTIDEGAYHHMDKAIVYF